MDSKVFGIPVVIWLFLFGLALLVGLPIFLEHQQEMAVLTRVERAVILKPMPLPEVSPTATPSATVTPTVPVKVYGPQRPVTLTPVK